MAKKSIYDLELHEGIVIQDEDDIVLSCCRVPGGWLYQITCPGAITQTFVPFDNKFMASIFALKTES